MPCAQLSHSFLDSAILARFAHIKVVSPHFIGLHAFYGQVYESMEGWFDRFAERARAEGEKFEPFEFKEPVEDLGDYLDEITADLDSLERACTTARKREEDPTTAAMIDEALEDIGKFLWQLRAMS